MGIDVNDETFVIQCNGIYNSFDNFADWFILYGEI